MSTTDQKSVQHDDAQVIVVGAGPVGLWLAGELALAGVRTLVLERNEHRSPHSKALGIHPRTVEVLAMRGVEQQFLAQGRPVPAWHFGMLDSRLDFRGLDTPYPFMLAFPQARTEQVLEQRAIDLGVPVLRGHTVTGLSQDEGEVHVQVTGPQGAVTRTALFVVGCDGAGSTVRKAAGIAFPGTDATAFGYVGEVVLDDPPQGLAPGWHNGQGALSVVPVADGRHRVFGIDASRQQPDDPFTLDELRDTAFRVAGGDFGMRDPHWLSRFGNATRVAAAFRRGRVLLAGDAAHMHFPAGGVGLNVGLQDAMNLGWKLAATVRGTCDPALLDSYHSERHPVGAALAESTLAQSALITATTPEGQALRSYLSRLIAGNPQLSLSLAQQVSALDVAYPAADTGAHPLVGTRVPAPEPTSGHSVFRLLHAGRPVLLNLTGAAWRKAPAHAAALGIATHPSTIAAGDRPAWSGVAAAVVRPDGHVWWAQDRTSTGLEDTVLKGLDALPARFSLHGPGAPAEEGGRRPGQ